MSKNQVSPSPSDMEMERVGSGHGQEPEPSGSTDQGTEGERYYVEDIGKQEKDMDHLKMDQLDPHEDHDTTVVSSSGRDSVSKISLLSSEEAVRKTPDFTVNQQAYTELTPVDGTQHDRQLQDGDIVESDDRPTKTLEDREISSGQRETSDTTHHSNRPESRFVEYENEGLVYEPGLPMPDRLHEPEYVAPSEDSRLQTNDKGYYTESSSLERTSTPDGRHPHVFNKEPTVFVGTLGGPALPSTASNQVMPVDEGTYHMAEMRQRQGHVQKEDSFIIGANENTDGPGCCGWLLYIFSVLLIILTLPFSLIFTIKVVQEYERAVIFRLGRLPSGGAKGPGIFFIIPCIESYTKVDLRTVSFDIPPQEVLTKDSVTVSVDAVVYYRVSNPTVSVANVENAHHSTRLLAQTTLRNILGTKNMTEILSDRESISQGMQATLDEATDRWGIKVERVEIKDVKLPVQLQRAMAAEAEAAREAMAKVIAAEGEQKAAKSLKEAADVIAQTGAALQLRYLQTLNSISAEKNSTIIFPLPMDMMSSFMKK